MKNNKKKEKRGGNPRKIKGVLQEALVELLPLPKGWIYMFVYIDGDPECNKPCCLN